MSDTALFGVDPVNGRSKWNILDHTGPTSYTTGGETWPLQSVYGGPNSAGLSGVQAVIPCGESISGNYVVRANYGGTGVRTSIKLKWLYSGGQGSGVTSVVQNAAGTGMTPGTYPLTFTNTGTNGSGAAGTVTVTATAVTNVVITNPGSGYTSAPTVAIGGTPGGTPATLTASIGPVGGLEVASGTNLSAETVRLLPIGG